MSTQNGASLKLVDKFSYLGSSVSSTESDINMPLAMAWTTIDKLSIIRKSDLSDKIKCNLFSAAVVSILLFVCIKLWCDSRSFFVGSHAIIKSQAWLFQKLLGPLILPRCQAVCSVLSSRYCLGDQAVSTLTPIQREYQVDP